MLQMHDFDLIDCQQGSPAWFAARLGIPTGSEAASIVARFQKNGVWVDKADRANYKVQLLCERLTGEVEEQGYISKEMRNGTEREPFARMAYESATGYMVRQSGFLVRRDIRVGCSLDGDINDFEGIIEAKCLKPKNHLAIIESGQVPEEHLPQVKHNLFCTGAQWCDFVAYCPKFPKHLQLFIKRINRDDAQILEYRGEVVAFLAELKALERKYRESAPEDLQNNEAPF
jgi:predicted phage-related endonuclease